MIKIFFLKFLNKYASRWVVLFVDVFLMCMGFIFAYTIRFNISFDFETTNLFHQIPLVVIVSLFSFLLVGSYKGIIRHTGTKDVINVFIGVSIFSFVITVIVVFNQLFDLFPPFTVPKGIILIHYLVSIFLLIISRYIFKSFFEIVYTQLDAIKVVLIYGAGDSGIITYGALNRERNNNYDIIGFIDDDPNKVNKKIDRVKIYKSSRITKEFIHKNDIDEVIISIQNIKPNVLLDISENLIQLGVKVKIVPPLSKWINGDLQANQIKQIDIDDLLGRQQIVIDNPIVKREVDNKVVFVTGAAGSIGSEISKQLATYNLKLLVLIDQAESPLYDLQQALLQESDKDFKAIVADVRDEERMREIFETYSPEIVFHAAAYKHVPLMEKSPYEAVKINISGTKNIADLSVEFEVSRFVMISTDKAVNPTNVMGATKRVAEMYINCLSKENNKTKFTTTRFGNVLGSNGSVIPLFKKQIEKGGPLTLTHKDITRYFMTISEACRLVLEAGTMGEGGEIYIFDMGKSVKIFDMAKRIITLSGLRYPEDIDITITGLRPGEKLFEELLANGEDTVKTYHEKIMIAKVTEFNTTTIKSEIEFISNNNHTHNNESIVSLLKSVVPEFISNNSKFEKLDKELAKG